MADEVFAIQKGVLRAKIFDLHTIPRETTYNRRNYESRSINVGERAPFI